MNTTIPEACAAVPVATTPALPPPRLRSPDRSHIVLRPIPLDYLLPPEHRARTVWRVVETFDLDAFYRPLKARGSSPGRSPTDPRLLVALWLYAYLDGVGCGHRLARLCSNDEGAYPYLWLCGGVSVCVETLNKFRGNHPEALDQLFSQLIRRLVDLGIVVAERISQDGTRVRASAGSSSFHRRATLERHLQRVQQRQAELAQPEVQAGLSAAQVAARQRCLRQRQARLQEALQQLPLIERSKEQQKDKPCKQQPPRASATDPQARRLRMADGGYRPAYNLQFAADTASRAIVGVEVSNAGSDAGLDASLRQQVQQRTGRDVREQLLDGGYVRLESIDQAAAAGVVIYQPLPPSRKAGTDPHARKPGDSEAVAAWRQRMGTAEAQAIYRERAALSETVNADAKAHRALARLEVRGPAKVRCVGLWVAMAYNVLHFAAQLLS